MHCESENQQHSKEMKEWLKLYLLQAIFFEVDAAMEHLTCEASKIYTKPS